MTRVLAATILVLSAACVPQPLARPALQLAAIRPDSVSMAGDALAEVELQGTGFVPGSPGQNTVVFGSMVLNHVPANDDGSRIRLVVPAMITSGGEAAPHPIESGAYAVRVRTPNGESNVATLRVFR